MLSEWHQTPEYISNNWTEEKLALLLQKRNERIERIRQDTEQPLREKPVTATMLGMDFKVHRVARKH